MKPLAIITGVGPGTGAALARRHRRGSLACRPSGSFGLVSFLVELRPFGETW